MAKICTIYDGVNDFYDTSLALRHLYKGSEAIQKNPEIQNIRSHGDVGYAQEFATIKMFASRRAGNTKAIAELCNYLTFHWLILGHNLKSIENTRAQCNHFHQHKILQSNKQGFISTKVRLTFGTINSIDQYRGWELRGIIVDCASTIKDEVINRIYELRPSMQNYSTEHFIFVG
jgi:hypothetical protein